MEWSFFPTNLRYNNTMLLTNVLTWVECRTPILNGIKNKLNLLWFIFELPFIIYFFTMTWFLFASTNAVHYRYGDWLCLKHPLWKKASMSANWIMLSIKFIKCHLMLKFSLQSKIWNNKIDDISSINVNLSDPLFFFN